jgi:hypothetical protein
MSDLCKYSLRTIRRRSSAGASPRMDLFIFSSERRCFQRTSFFAFAARYRRRRRWTKTETVRGIASLSRLPGVAPRRGATELSQTLYGCRPTAVGGSTGPKSDRPPNIGSLFHCRSCVSPVSMLPTVLFAIPQPRRSAPRHNNCPLRRPRPLPDM